MRTSVLSCNAATHSSASQAKLDSEHTLRCDSERRLEGELEKLREELSEHAHQDALREAVLSDMKNKVELLSTALDREVEGRKKLEEEVRVK